MYSQDLLVPALPDLLYVAAITLVPLAIIAVASVLLVRGRRRHQLESQRLPVAIDDAYFPDSALTPLTPYRPTDENTGHESRADSRRPANHRTDLVQPGQAGADQTQINDARPVEARLFGDPPAAEPTSTGALEARLASLDELLAKKTITATEHWVARAAVLRGN